MAKPLQFLIVFACIASLAACGPLPRPFAHSGPVESNSLPSLPNVGDVRVSVDSNLPESLSNSLINNMIKSLWAASIPASTGTNFTPRYFLNGQLKVSYPPASDAEWIELIWILSNAKGQRIGAFDRRFSGDRAGWLFLDKDLLGDLITDIGKDVVQLVYAQQKPKLSNLKELSEVPQMGDKAERNLAISSPDKLYDSDVFKHIPKIFLAEIIGAPGDGNKSLYRNMQRSMLAAGVTVVSERSQSAYLVKGFVNVSPSYNGANDVSITWLVATKEGQKLGKVSQKNRILAGFLHGRWGDIAHIAAQGGSRGIIDILEQHMAPGNNNNRLVIP